MNNLKARRQERGLTQKELAEAVDLTESAISKFEQGTRRPGIDNAMKIAKILKTTTGKLWG